MYLNPQHKTYKDNLKFLSFGFLKFQKFFDIKNIFLKIIIIVFSAIFMGFLNFFIIERVGIYTPGINSLYQAIARLFLQNNSKNLIAYRILFWITNIFFNIIFAIIFWKYLGNKFTLLTILFIFISGLTGFILSSLPESFGFKYFYIFSDPNTSNSMLKINNIILLPWPTNTYQNDANKIFIFFLYAFVYVIFASYITLIIYSLGGSTGGLDWIIFYLYKEKNYSCNRLFFLIGSFISILSYIIGTYSSFLIKNIGTLTFKEIAPNLLSPTLLATALIIFIKKQIFDCYHPQFKLVKLTVFSSKWIEIRSSLIETNFPHSFTVIKSIGSYELRHQNTLEFICFAIELSSLIKNIRKIDKICLIVATKIETINGYINLNNVNINDN